MVLSTYLWVTSIKIISPLLIEPDNTLSPSFTFWRTASPVKLEVSSIVFPLVTIPSTGIDSPFLTTIISPILSSSDLTSLIVSFTFKLAFSTFKESNSSIPLLLLLTAFSSNILPIT